MHAVIEVKGETLGIKGKFDSPLPLIPTPGQKLLFIWILKSGTMIAFTVQVFPITCKI
jgi:hypothetical protein